MKVLTTLAAIFFCVQAMALSSAPPAIEQFFQNYGLLASGWDAFVAGQSPLLNENMVTVVRDHRGTTTYRAPQGYFESIGDWSKNFKTGPDFRVEFLGWKDGQYRVALLGSLTFDNGVRIVEIPERMHCWEETFVLDDSGRIGRLEVNMNLHCRR